MSGLNFDAKGNLPRPTPPRAPTIWIGGAAEKTLERVVKWGSGWCPFFGPQDGGGQFRRGQRSLSSIDDLRDRVSELREMWDAAGRTDPLDICVNLLDTPTRMDESDANRCLETVGTLSEAGATWVFTGHPHPSRAAFLEHAEWFGREIIAKSR